MSTTDSTESIRLVIADDIPLFREMLVHTLEEEDDIEIIAHAANGLEAVDACRLHRPHIILLDVEMPKMNGVEATKIIRAECPEQAADLTCLASPFIRAACPEQAAGLIAVGSARSSLSAFSARSVALS